MRSILKAVTLESKFPLLAVEADYIISKDADIAAVFEVDLPELFAVATAEYEAIHAAWTEAIEVLPNYTVVYRQDWFIQEDYCSQTDKENLNFLSRSYEMHFSECPFSNHRYYLYLTKTAKERMRIQSSFSSLCRGFIVPEEMDKDTTAHLLDMVGQFARVVNDTGLVHLRRLVGDGIIGTENKAGLVEEYFCLLVENTTALEDIELGDDGLRVGDKHVSVHTLSELDALPSKMGTDCRYERLSTDEGDCKLSFASPVGLLLSYNHLYNQYIFLDNSGENLQRFKKNARNMQSLSKYSRSNQINKEWIDSYLNDAHSFGLTSVRAHCNIIAWTDNPMKVKNMHNDVDSQITTTEYKPRHNAVDVTTLYQTAMLGNGANFPAGEGFYTFIEQTLCFWVEETNYRSSVPSFGLKMSDRISRKPLHVDIPDLLMKRGIAANHNKFVLGDSGSGKSFFVNHLARQYYEQGAHVVLIDTGNSYQGLCPLTRQKSDGKSGIYSTCAGEGPIAFNPPFMDDKVFDIKEHESIKTLILTLWRKDNEPAARSEEVALSNAVSLYIRRIRGDESIVSSLSTSCKLVKTDYQRILEEKEVREKDFNFAGFLDVLGPYYRSGEYDFLLNSDERLDSFGKRFIVFEVDQVKDHPIFFPVTTIIIMGLFISKMRRLKGVRKMIIIEKAWKTIAKEGMAGYIHYLFKAVRKFYGKAVIATQGVDDIISSPVAKESIVDNSDRKILLDQREYLNKFSQIQSLLGLTDKGGAQILSVNMSNDPRRKYKGVWFGLGGVQSTVCATEISLEKYLCCLTEESEKVELEGLTKELGGNIELAIRRLAEEGRNQNNEIPQVLTEYETLFPFYWICGKWKSGRKSPPVTVFRDGDTYKVTLIYHLDAVMVGMIHQGNGIIQADLPGRVQLVYDREEDRLVLATEGVYVCADDS